MPELPEVETVKRGLEDKLRGRKVVAVDVLRPQSIGFPSAADFAKKLKGHTFGNVIRRGKYLVFELDKGAALGGHLRMSGRLLVLKPSAEAKNKVREEHVRVRMMLDDGNEFIFEDMRVFGRLWYVPKNAKPEDVIGGLGGLGPEPLSDDFNECYLWEVLRTRTGPIKGALLDQTLIAGIGNIYADESLHLSGINPARPAQDLTRPQIRVLVQRVKEVLANAIEKRGSSLRNYTDSDGVNGNYQRTAYVYGRENDPCRTCKNPIVRVKLAGRSSHYCPTCQPGATRKRR